MYNDSFRKRYKNAPIAISYTENFAPTSAHIHNEVELLYIINGSCEIQISNTSYQASQGDLIFVNPLEVHSVMMDDKSPYCHKCICFDLSLIVDKKLSDELQKGYAIIPHHFKADDEITKKLSALFDVMYEAVTKNSNALLFEITAQVSTIFSILINNELLQSNSFRNAQTKFTSEVINYISLHYFESLTSKEIAQALFYTQSHFCRRFKTVFGVSFSEYLNMYRLLIAKEKLVKDNKSVGAVATECGFASLNYFTACFKKNFKMTPLKYKKKSIQ